ncbi:MAG: CBS domain-containing protein, partial [Phycisphaerae bacterium]
MEEVYPCPLRPVVIHSSKGSAKAGIDPVTIGGPTHAARESLDKHTDPRSKQKGETGMPIAQDILANKSGDVAIIGEEATVMEAAKIMSDRRIGSLVVGRREKVVGIFTER